MLNVDKAKQIAEDFVGKKLSYLVFFKGRFIFSSNTDALEPMTSVNVISGKVSSFNPLHEDLNSFVEVMKKNGKIK